MQHSQCCISEANLAPIKGQMYTEAAGLNSPKGRSRGEGGNLAEISDWESPGLVGGFSSEEWPYNTSLKGRETSENLGNTLNTSQ